jgi:hypothetical protein
MYIEVSLLKNNRTEIKSLFKEGNVSYLVKGENNPDFPYLSQVESYDYSVFDASDMDGIIEELIRVRTELEASEDQQHIDDIIRLANKCKEIPNTVLVFAG